MYASCVWLTLVAGACCLAEDVERPSGEVKQYRDASDRLREAFRQAKATRTISNELADSLIGTPSRVVEVTLGDLLGREVRPGYELWHRHVGSERSYSYVLVITIANGRVERCSVEAVFHKIASGVALTF